MERVGMVNLRTYDCYCLRRVAVPEESIRQSPWLQVPDRDEESKRNEMEIIQELKDYNNEEILNPREEEGNIVFN